MGSHKHKLRLFHSDFVLSSVVNLECIAHMLYNSDSVAARQVEIQQHQSNWLQFYHPLAFGVIKKALLDEVARNALGFVPTGSHFSLIKELELHYLRNELIHVDEFVFCDHNTMHFYLLYHNFRFALARLF